MDWLFDGINKVIKEPPGTGDTSFDVKRDIYSAWKRWAESNSQFEAAFAVEGGTPIGSTGLFTGSTFLLVNGWKLQGADHDHQVIVEGNLFSADGIVATANPNNDVTLFVSASVNAQGIATSSVQQDILDNVNLLVQELHRIQGLDIDNPMTITPTRRIAGDLDLELGGDGETITTVTRQ